MLPTFLIVGAMKSGTTALYTLFDQHPDVYMSPVKEPNFFAFAGTPPNFQAPLDRRPQGINHTSITAQAEYEQLFAGAEADQPRGEASHTSLYWPDAPANIERLIPDVRLIAILRNPVDRAYSEFMHFRRDGNEPLDFEAALEAEEQRIQQHWAMGRYVDRGRYDEQIQRYLDRFDRDQLKVVLHEDFVSDPEGVLSDLFRHIGVDDSVDIDPERRVNKSGLPQSRLFHTLLTGLQPVREALAPVLPERLVHWANAVKNRNLSKPSMDEELRKQLVDVFRPHVVRLESMIGRDLQQWREA